MSDYIKITETPSDYTDLELMNTQSILENINNEDRKVAEAVQKVIPQLTILVDEKSLQLMGCLMIGS
jgi:N-acetylmuramic acid 6-phosphate etherase